MDRRLGVVLCFFLTVLEKLRLAVFPSARRMPPVRRILFVKPVEQGALVLAYGAIRDAAERLGRENVFVFVFAKNREILDILDVIPRENVITVRDTSLATLALDMMRAVLQMRRLRIDTAIDFEIFARFHHHLLASGGASARWLHRFNSEGPYRGSLVTHRVQYILSAHLTGLRRVCALGFRGGAGCAFTERGPCRRCPAPLVLTTRI